MAQETAAPVRRADSNLEGGYKRRYISFIMVLVPPTVPPMPVTPVVPAQPVVKQQQREQKNVKTQTARAVDAPEKTEHADGPRRDRHPGERLDLEV